MVTLVGAMIFLAFEGRQAAPEVARISGRLTLEGLPMLPGHSVVFMEPSRGDLAFGITDADGRFVVNSSKNGEMVPGRFKVYLVPPSVKPGRLGGDHFDDDFFVKLPAEYPDKYVDLKTTPLIYDVAPGENWFQIDVDRKQSPSWTDESAADPPRDEEP